MAALDLRKEDGLRAYLDSHGIDYLDVTVLTGGNANFVHRVTFKDGTTRVYKHAASHLQFNTDFFLDPARMDYEDRALEILPSLLTKELPESRMHPARWYGYDRRNKLLCLGDGGDQNLKAAYPNQNLDIPLIGRELGRWIAALHICSRSTSFADTDNGLESNNPIAVDIYRYSYNGLADTLSKFGQDAKFAAYINEEFGSRLTKEDECVCHGDYWPGNVLVKGGGEHVELTMVDWEMTRRGISATDVGQFAAEAFLLDRFKGGRGLLPVFLNSYLDMREKDATADKVALGREWLRRMIVHWGVHIAFWPVGFRWTDEDGTKELVDIGVRVMKTAVEGDWEQLRRVEPLEGVAEEWAKVWDRVEV
ncbi:hypothetical protein BS50DRAFT_222246 [Corynespora cassiicola Philippines]|uniref:Aminoglycoside phosphotransferase domain-containing protein n=1 Tax=Corynespora cassiicola Philippines TaxID=1448308 RepID=A0A2T2N3A7_CORCC|nr:hypothetical protein BS50DRAFT_222246 [Corynespora cassiicola Philippines]